MSAEPAFVVIDTALGDAMRRVQEKILTGDASRLPELAGWLGHMSALVQLRIAGVGREAIRRDLVEEDELLEPEEVAKAFGQDRSWVYKHSRDLPFRVKVPGSRLKFSKKGMQNFLKNRRAG